MSSKPHLSFRRMLILVLSIAASATGCLGSDGAGNAGDTPVGVGDTPDPAPQTPADACAAIAAFPGWDKVAAVPELNADNRPTLWYAVIPVTSSQQVSDLQTVGLHVEDAPFILDAGPVPPAGGTAISQKSICPQGQVEWALVPGAIFNYIATTSVADQETLVEAISIIPVPTTAADASVTYQGMHPVSYAALSAAGFQY
jgi:hypothetical protein